MMLSSAGTEDTMYRVSSLDLERLINISPSSYSNSLTETKCVASTPIPSPLVTLPHLLFTDRSHFIINSTIITRSEVELNSEGVSRPSSVLLRDPIYNGIVSITISLLSLTRVNHQVGGIRFGFFDSTAPFPKVGEVLGCDVKDSVSISSSTGLLWHKSPSAQNTPQYESCHFFLKEGDCVRMEVDMDSTPRTVQFFLNGNNGRYFVSGLPPSVRIGFSVSGQGTSWRIDRIIQLERSTPLAPEIKELNW
ncbi:hypothetical protein BLNAU_21823 [Blattamonas nauphoetae]|uniref:SPRY domain-containing protein n=1 Tax=Blattamonas nauphoetae TaxID=2049346 RepID=A0ABQ9WUR7_9EUKA|nr:hypothetical protein BLNAU_21823 [Blattamonas nauphoetae]